MKFFDPSLYLLTDQSFFKTRTLFESVHQAVLGGVTLVQLREKTANPQTVSELARALVKLLRPYKIPLILNDRVEIVRESGAQGVHLGSKDMPPGKARAFLGAEAIIGYSVEAHQDFHSLPLSNLDYIAASPVFPTETKEDAPPPFSKEQLGRLRQITSLPLIAIGGINLKNMDTVLDSGVDGIALISAILGAPDIIGATRQLKEKITISRKNRLCPIL